ncbi:FkbM family methyltransferase [Rosistilla oblonga]|uniref:FkbM family methyltransferase n=1 Tax=Rosistilla oblonga TaxID=2527990 RepID=UPI003A987BCD
MRFIRTITGFIREVLLVSAKADAISSVFRYATDLLRVKFGKRSSYSDGLRSIQLSGATVSYRLNRGDMQSIREIWLDEEYRLPDSAAPHRVLIDLGANIGMTSLWLTRRYGYETVVAVEPSAENAKLVRQNLANNGINAIVIEAAVGPVDGTAVFASSEESNMGRLDENAAGVEVTVKSMESILRDANISDIIDLVKLDIEGGEEKLVESNLEWLSSVRRIVAELHPSIVDTGKVIAEFQRAGLQYQPGPGRGGTDSAMDMFVREA